MKLFSSNCFIYFFIIIMTVILLLYIQRDLFTFGQTQIFTDMINATVKVEQDIIFPNENQIINVQVFDAKTNESISLASIDLIVKDTNNFITKVFSGLTDETGKFLYSWKIDENAKPGTYRISLDIIATGYKPLAKTETFIVDYVNDNNIT